LFVVHCNSASAYGRPKFKLTLRQCHDKNIRPSGEHRFIV